LSWLDSQSGESRPVHVGPIEPKYALPAILNALVPFGIGSSPTNDPSLPANGGTAFAGLDLTDYELGTPGIEADRDFFAHNEQETTRFQVGFRGDFQISDKPWHYDLSVTRGDSEFSTHFLGLDSDRLELAAYGLGGPGYVPNGSLTGPTADFVRGFMSGNDGLIDTRVTTAGSQGTIEGTLASLTGTLPGQPFINPDNVLTAFTSTNRCDNAQGCFFFNPYLTRATAAGANSEELLQWLEVPIDPAQRSETFITVADFVVSGELMDMKAGPLSMALGLQRREEGRKTFVNPKTIGAINSFGQLSNQESVAGLSENRSFDAERDINAVFFEFGVPLTEDIDIQFAGRYEDYGSDIGSTFDPKLGVRWQATDSRILRSSASSSFRGPGLAQIEEGTGFSLEFGVPDVLAAVAATSPAGANCARTGRCAVPTAGVPTIIVKQGLAPEEAVTYNIGGIWAPVDGRLAGLEIGLDYYNIEINDKIIDVPTQSLLTEELVLFNAALAANDFVIAVPGVPGFGLACDPTEAQFDPGTAETGEACQVNPNSYAINPGNSGFVDGKIDTYYAFDLNYTYAMPLNDSELVFTFGALDLFEADLPELKNANGTDLLVFDPRGRRIYGSVKFSL
jgi:outer membrane receptor protein involved in Fe transport